ncbi:hypothetical protein HBA43_07660 [Providencia rettgeri]|uniref:colicin Z C-terminal domain-related protein n=1 Tax=Providencia TaxID=586 RepID=UPI001419DCB8|nr:colicin Z C-terminal domain-related protein [Providencia rettgeri]EMA4782577.1 hypothetical protein [Providencia rettgeri]EMB3083064.1 hypothetical protein [Providencia rettgeri]MBN6350791.1 hypothetical protein [Providencia rettgeri]NIA74770.1 hypothetical protein [Providencia rettgeri]NIA78283.1 hypothetical protein [Providencia rettgeri]
MARSQGWAPPLAWGPWVNLHTHVGNSAYTVSFDAVSSLQSTFDAEIQYVTNSGERTVRTMGPGSYRINGNNGAGQDRIRFKSHSVGLTIEVRY